MTSAAKDIAEFSGSASACRLKPRPAVIVLRTRRAVMTAKSTGKSSDDDKRPESWPIDDETTDGVEVQKLRE